MSYDEFDNIPDEFAGVEGIDWSALLTGSSTTPPGSSALPCVASSSRPYHTGPLDLSSDPPESQTRDSSYFFEGTDFDAAFLAELDHLEKSALAGNSETSSQSHSNAFGVQSSESVAGGPSPVTVSPGQLLNEGQVRSSRHFPRTDPISTDAVLPPKRACPPDHRSDQISQKRKGKMKANNEMQDILSAYEDELTCPICCDLLVAAHVGNPCGHTFCGECGWQWHVENKNHGCPCCRQLLDKSTPMIPNIAIDNTVERHVSALALSGATEWEPKGRKHRDWANRKDSWRAGASKREKQKARIERKAKSFVQVHDIAIFDSPENGQEIMEGVPIFEDSDIELIPRPMRRARRRRRDVR